MKKIPLLILLSSFILFLIGCTPPDDGYKVGDYYNVGNVQGVVYKIHDSDGKHGMLLSLDETARIPWAKGRYNDLSIGARDQNNGLSNMKLIKNYNISNFPAFEWCDKRNETSETSGWYLPAPGEILDFVRVSSELQTTLFAEGGTVLGYNRYLSSAEAGMDKCYYINWTSTDSTLKTTSKDSILFIVRAVRSF